MSVTVRHLNADSSFLVIFSPKTQPAPDDLLSSKGAFSVLIDPWIVGSSVISAEWFAVTRHVIPSSIQHLSEIEEPDVVLVSQNKPDHCHKQTLLQLRPEGKTLFAAEPRAAKAIKSWNHFDPHRVHALAKYHAKRRFRNTLRLRIPPLGPDGLPGEVNIAFIPAKNYVTGLHNAFGITYQPPTHGKGLAPMSTIDLPQSLDLDTPFSPASVPAQSPLPMLSPVAARPVSSYTTSSLPPPHSIPASVYTAGASVQTARHRPQLSKSTATQSSDILPHVSDRVVESSQANPRRLDSAVESALHGIPDINFDVDALIDTIDFANTLPTPPLSPSASSSAVASPRISNLSDSARASTNTSSPFSLPNSPSLRDLQSRYSRPPVVRPARPNALSILYTPHGIPLADIQSYIQTHLVPLPGALPLTCLFHSFDYATNPWWFGGNIMMGMDGGIEIARALMARNWISAHDEEKDDRGVGIKLLKCNRNSVDLVKQEIARVDNTWECEVRSLDVGTEVRLLSHSKRTDPTILTCSGGEAIGLGVDMAGFGCHDGG